MKEILLRLLGPFHDKARGIVEGMRPERVMVHNDWICVDPAKAVWNRQEARCRSGALALTLALCASLTIVIFLVCLHADHCHLPRAPSH